LPTETDMKYKATVIRWNRRTKKKNNFLGAVFVCW